MITIDHTALAIHRQHPIGITIKGKSHLCTTADHGLAQRFEMGGTTAHIDAGAIGFTMQNGEIGA